MRSREEINKELDNADTTVDMQPLIVEVLLDIRDILMKQSEKGDVK